MNRRRVISFFALLAVLLLIVGLSFYRHLHPVRPRRTSAASSSHPPGTRRVNLPRDCSLGTLYTCDWGELESWTLLGPALGTIHIPKGKALSLGVVPMPSTQRDSFLRGMLRAVGLGSEVDRPIDFAPLSKLAADDLQGIDARNAPVRDSDLRHLAGMTSLYAIDFSHTLVTDEGLRRLRDFVAVRDLRLAGARITDQGLASLARLLSIENLDLSGTQITDAGIECIEKLESLRHLDVRGTEITEAGYARLKTALPGCTVQWTDESAK